MKKSLVAASMLLTALLFPYVAMGQTIEKAVSDTTAQAQENQACALAALSANLETLNKCLKKGFDTNTKVNGVPCIFGALQKESVLFLLAGEGTDINATDEENRTLLMHAALQGNANLMHMLVSEYKANTLLKDNDGKTAADYAKMRYADMTDALNGKAPSRTVLYELAMVRPSPKKITLFTKESARKYVLEHHPDHTGIPLEQMPALERDLYEQALRIANPNRPTNPRPTVRTVHQSADYPDHQ